MDYGKVIGKAWQISKRWKVLWLLGLLSVLSLVFALNVSPGGGVGTDVQEALARAILPPGFVALAASISCVAVFLAIALWVVSVIARGGLIAGVKQIVEKGETDFGSAWGEGASRFWSLFGIGVLMLIAFWLVALVIALLISLLNMFMEALFGASLDVWSSMIVVTFMSVIATTILGVIRIYAEQAAVQEKMSWTGSFGRGWQVLKENLATTLVLLFFFLGVGIIIWVIVLLIGVVLGVGVGAAFWNTVVYGSGGLMGTAVCCFGIVGFIVALVLEGFLQTFVMSTWTLAYREMTGLDEAPQEQEEETTEEEAAEEPAGEQEEA